MKNKNKKIDTMYGFYQTPSGQWYIDIPGWKEDLKRDIAELEMVLGADTMLTNIANGKDKINLRISNKRFKSSSVLKRMYFAEQQYGGAFYRLPSFEGVKYGTEMWLCAVTIYIFNKMPQKIYIKRAG